MIKKEIPIPSPQDLRKFGIMMAVVLSIFGSIAIWRQYWTIFYVLGGIAGFVFLLPALLFPTMLQPVYRYWMKFAMALGWFNSRVILSLTFYLLFTPISFIQKLIGRDAMEREFPKKTDSYWIDRSQETYKPKHFEKQF
ncbi:MAG: hypothetical protein C4527_21760 [Candidatus Omnitrophota bacterium]|nr:MAG: hypothetical protein C4527_21760 [Candidatus Omnitrophota bacterium]